MKRKLLICAAFSMLSTCTFSQNFTKSTIDGSTPAEPYTIASGYLNNDAYLDIAIGTDTGSVVEWYKNDGDVDMDGVGDGTFTAMGALVASGSNALSYVEGITIADINGDGDEDILATSYVNNNLVWFENNGNETFQDAVEISDGIIGAGTVLVANIDNDANGYLDVIVTAYAGNSVVYMLGNGDGTFGTLRYIVPVTAGSGPGSADIADFDGDGDLDVVVAFTDNGDIKVYDNKLIPDGIDGSGNVPFVAYDNTVDTGNGYLWVVSFADLNNDGSLEIVKSDNNPSGGAANVAWYTKDSSGTATTFTENNITTTITRTAMASVADFNNDNYNDLLVTNGRATNVDYIWFTNNTSGGFGSEIVIDDTSSTGFDLELQDFDNDGDMDIVGVSYLQDDVVYFENDFISLSIDENTINNLTMFPNPTKNILNFKGHILGPLHVTVYDMLGKQLLVKEINDNNILDVSELASGIYTIRVNDSSESLKFIKQ